MAGTKQISDIVPKLTKLAFGQKSTLLARLILHWPEIMGQDMALKIKPAEISYRAIGGKSKTKKRIILALFVPNGSVALELQYQTAMIIDKINRFLGAGGIDDIKFVQAPEKFSIVEDDNSFDNKLSEDEIVKIENIVDDAKIADDSLTEALKSLGKAILNDVKNR